MNIKPTSDRLIVKIVKEENKSPIITPDTVEKKITTGVVMAKGSMVSNEIQIGDMVFFGEFAGTEYSKDEVDYLIVNEGEILCVLGGEDGE